MGVSEKKDPVSNKAIERAEELLRWSYVSLGWNSGLQSPTTPVALRAGPARDAGGWSAPGN